MMMSRSSLLVLLVATVATAHTGTADMLCAVGTVSAFARSHRPAALLSPAFVYLAKRQLPIPNVLSLLWFLLYDNNG